MLNVKTGVLAVMATLSLSACTTNEYGERRLSTVGKGAAIGAAGGAAIGALTGNVVAGAALGAAAGTVAGIVANDRNRYEDRDGYRYYDEPDGRR